ncbi:hypothetical protein MHU86_19306 [Fragilaria crotonensis]|nr:hypothetical protein MHU86_19306 [Fragilaria crotonensis]
MSRPSCCIAVQQMQQQQQRQHRPRRRRANNSNNNKSSKWWGKWKLPSTLPSASILMAGDRGNVNDGIPEDDDNQHDDSASYTSMGEIMNDEESVGSKNSNPSRRWQYCDPWLYFIPHHHHPAIIQCLNSIMAAQQLQQGAMIMVFSLLSLQMNSSNHPLKKRRF